MCSKITFVCFTKYKLYKYSSKIKGQVQNISHLEKQTTYMTFRVTLFSVIIVSKRKGTKVVKAGSYARMYPLLLITKCISYLQRQRLNCIILIVWMSIWRMCCINVAFLNDKESHLSWNHRFYWCFGEYQNEYQKS